MDKFEMMGFFEILLME